MMARKGRTGLSASQREALWERWRQGQSMSEIGRALERHSAFVYKTLKSQGGIYRAPRRRSRLALSLVEREDISRGLAAGRSMRAIAAELARSPSTVSREVERHGGRDRYRAADADTAALVRARRPKLCKLARDLRLKRIVASKLSLNWSPEQISGWLKRTHPDDEAKRVSHETIYRSLFVQAHGVLKQELIKHLRTHRLMRRSKHASARGQKRGQIVDAISIRERPASVEDRAVPGHWEGDLIAGSRSSYIATLVERRSRFTLLVKLKDKDSNSVAAALIRKIKRLPPELRRSLTWDRGTELAQHKQIAISTDCKIYFCDPQSPWQRGSNENTNRLLRQYFPKGTDLSVHSQADLNRVSRQLNQRPRKTLEYQTPAERLQASVALTD